MSEQTIEIIPQYIKFTNGDEILCCISFSEDEVLTIIDPIKIISVPYFNPRTGLVENHRSYLPYLPYSEFNNTAVLLDEVFIMTDMHHVFTTEYFKLCKVYFGDDSTESVH